MFSDERTRKTTSVTNFILNKFLKFASRCLEVVWHIGLNEHIESSIAFSFCYKTFLGYWQHLFQQHDFPFNVYKSVANNSKEQALLMDQDRGKP